MSRPRAAGSGAGTVQHTYAAPVLRHKPPFPGHGVAIESPRKIMERPKKTVTIFYR